jgi:hypothetical protein
MPGDMHRTPVGATLTLEVYVEERKRVLNMMVVLNNCCPKTALCSPRWSPRVLTQSPLHLNTSEPDKPSKLEKSHARPKEKSIRSPRRKPVRY